MITPAVNANVRLMPEIAKPLVIPEIPGKIAGNLDLERILTISDIRVHTKTDDTPHVTDRQLELYRRAAFEAAEQYTGFLLMQTTQQIEDVKRHHNIARGRHRPYKHTLRYPSADGIVHLYGSRDGLGDRTLSITPGSRSVHIPMIHTAIGTSPCCDPCGSGRADPLNFGLKIMYLAGFRHESDIPAGVILGCLKYIAWSIENPGDALRSVKDTAQANLGVLQGTNNIAWASGALELWRQYDPEAI